ncbi:Tektin-2 [Schistosoma japonicum]|uniref:Tektin n=1 Tax=Schistosoma japonicum TaxID=6182 RepID=C1LFS0_SCHJA|nr:Tektin-2 [Schistosoma japonicum]TNN17058.1 Tektin-2 [Schistosoma japonicum]CAX73548.1 Tektin-2 [Schistosoma japonicum]
MSTLNKPSIKYQPPDWFTNSFALSANSQRQREASEQIRQETRSLRLAAALRTKWDEFNNTTRLADRVDAIRDLKDILELAQLQLDTEVSMVNLGKEAVEEQMKNIIVHKDCITECLTLRDRRKKIDNVHDAPEVQLKKEKELIDKTNRKLQQKVDEAFEQIILLKEAKQQVLLDLQDKHTAMEIDIQQYKLRPTCPGVSFKPNPTRIPKTTTTPQQWEEFTRYNWQRAQAEIYSGQRLREAIYQTICQVSNDLEAQTQATEFALRQRKHDFEQALDELNWQKKQIEDEMAEMENDLDQLEKAIHSLIPMGKLAQTRLERRTYRPGVELCRDSAQYGLTDEVKQIEVTNEALLEKQRQARHALDALHKQLNRINDDITLKEQSLQIENDCLNLRHQRMNHKQPEKDFDPNIIESYKSNEKLINKPPTFIERHVAEKLLA